MSTGRWTQISPILDALFDIEPSKREAYIHEHCGHDPALVAEIKELASFVETNKMGSEDFLEQPPLAEVDGQLPTQALEADKNLMVEGDDLIGQQLHGYEILGLAGRGGMGVVYKARDPNIDRIVALKMMSPALARDPQVSERFKRAAKILGRLTDPRIVSIYEMRGSAENAFIALEYVDGENLRQIVGRQGPLPWPRALEIIIEVGEALGHVHEANIIHRDVKSSNIMIAKSGAVKLMDFGLGRLQDAGVQTMSMNIMGSPPYMPPEQFSGLVNVDQRSDIYGLGMSLYEILVGKLPFDAGVSHFDIREIVMQSGIRPPSEEIRAIPEAVSAAVMKSMAADPDDRFQTVGEMVGVLRGLLDPAASAGPAAPPSDASGFTATRSPKPRFVEPASAAASPRSSRTWLSIGGLVIAAAAMLGAYLWYSGGADPPAVEHPVFTVSQPENALISINGEALASMPLPVGELATVGCESNGLRADIEVVVGTDAVPECRARRLVRFVVVGKESADGPVAALSGASVLEGETNALNTGSYDLTFPDDATQPDFVMVDGEEVVSTDGARSLPILPAFDDSEVIVQLHYVAPTAAAFNELEQARVGQPPAVANAVSERDREEERVERKGKLVAETTGSGSVYVDGERLNGAVDLAVGPHEIRCGSGQSAPTKTLNIAANQETGAHCYFDRLVTIGLVDADSGEPIETGAILIDGARHEKTYRVPVGTGFHTFGARKMGYGLKSASIDGKIAGISGDQTRIHIPASFENEEIRLILALYKQ